MEDEVCMHSKFGYCKFKQTCNRKHYSEICQDFKACQTIETCPKRHPNRCKKYISENGCNFGSDCAYTHGINNDTIKAHEIDAKIDRLEKICIEMASKLVNKENVTVNTDDTELKDKVKMLEAVVQKMFLNIIKLEAEVQDFKAETKNKIKETDDILTGKTSKEKMLSSKPVNEVDVKDTSKSSDDFKCEMCEYSSKKRNMLNKHMNTKHNDCKCKICYKVFPNSMDALMHTAKEHTKNIIEEFPKFNTEIVKDAIIFESREHSDSSSVQSVRK